MAKGLELDLVGTMIIALVGIALLLAFTNNTIQQAMSDGFCYLTEKIGVKPNWCKPSGFSRLTEEIEPRTTQQLAIDLASRAIICWQDAIKPAQKKDVVCSEVFLKTHPGRLTEYDFTKVMETQGGCEVLQNYLLVDELGGEYEYDGDCGDQDQIGWEIYGGVIENQTLIRIKYDTTQNKILIKG
ncbi:MAG: hypothetical protein JW727_01245 [Candidatus Aenigmarchaeota archaeon]|nr:hypothetical protein [Candidatus Aenigmarchaeota archaeon]